MNLNIFEHLSLSQLFLIFVVVLGVLQLIFVGGGFSARNNNHLNEADANFFQNNVAIIGQEEGKTVRNDLITTVQGRAGMRAGMYTPFHLTPGGGERYFLSSALVMQDLGYSVTILVPRNSIVRTLDEVRATAEALRISLDYSRLSLEMVHNPDKSGILLDEKDSALKMDTYDVFYSLGNNKLPDVTPLGKKFNIFMCQFPFNFEEWDEIYSINAFSLYDLILLNSRFTHHWYSKSVAVSYQELMKMRLPVPSISILFPPVEPFHVPVATRTIGNSAASGLIPFHERDAASSTFNIVMLGRFFVGRQNKGHFAALRILQRLLSEVPLKTRQKVRLVMMGKIQPEPKHHEYFRYLKGNATALNLPVEFLNDATPDDIEKTLQRSHLFWHLTGIDVINDIASDPASIEHFGISVVEAMSAGCIPIVLSQGGTTDIVDDGKTGFWANNEDDFVTHTLRVLKMSGFLEEEVKFINSPKLQTMSQHCVEASRRFHLNSFRSNLYLLVQRGVLSHRFRNVMQETVSTAVSFRKSVAMSTSKVALIVAATVDGTFQAVVTNVMGHLPTDWGLVVVYSASSEFFVRHALRHFVNVRFVAMPEAFSITSVNDYNKMMMSAQFWKSIQAEKVLLFQTDSIILHSRIEPFLKYDYIGAPWDVPTNERVMKLVQGGLLQSAVGNGGFSLRSTEAMIKACERLHWSGNASMVQMEQEDLYFARTLPTLGFTVAPVDVAYNFSVEVPLTGHAYSRLEAHHKPFALHSAWYYWKDEMLEEWYNQARRGK